MVSTSSKAAAKLREHLIYKCLEAGIGFRILVDGDEATFSIMVDREHQGDQVTETGGVKVFVDPSSAASIGRYQLDYEDEPAGGFYLREAQEDTRNEQG